MALTARDLNRATLHRQLLLTRHRLPLVDAVRRVVAIQAQEPPSPYLAMWARVADFDPADLDAAFSSAEVVKATLMRITLHAVAADDYPAFHEAMLGNLRASRLNDARFAGAGLTIPEADGLVPHLVGAAADRPLTKTDVEAVLADVLGEPPHQGLWWALRSYAPLVHAPAGPPWSFGRTPAFRPPPDAPRPDRSEALGRLVERYLSGFGPASPNDFAQWALQQRSVAKAAFASLGDRLVVREGPDGASLYDVYDGVIPDGDTPAPPRLLPMWESTLLSYHDRSRVLPESHRRVVIRSNGDVLPTLLVDGLVAGVWRPTDGGIEAKAFSALSSATWDRLEEEAVSLAGLIASRDTGVYRRFDRWWDRVDAAVTRRLA